MRRLVDVKIDNDFLACMEEPDHAVLLTNDICDKCTHVGGCYGVMIAGLVIAGIGAVALTLTNKTVSAFE